MSPLVTVITAVKNGEKSIKKCIDSCLNQTYANIEHLLVLGNSADKTNQIVAKYSECQTIKILKEQRPGIFSSLNYGITQSHGKYILILGSDDWLQPTCIHDLVSELLYSSADFAVGYANIFAGNSIDSQTPSSIFKVNNFDERMLLGEMPFCHQALLASRNCFEICGLFDETLTVSADHEWVKRLFLNNLKIAILHKPVVNFTAGGASSNEELAKTEIINSICQKYQLPYQEVWQWMEFITGNDTFRVTGIKTLIKCSTDIKIVKSLALHMVNIISKKEKQQK
jgi:glycosyltransferase involved in cell wall biosynthesis